MKHVIILVEPGESRNIGSVARLMSNFGFDDLRIISPRNFRIERAQATACHGDQVLHSARYYQALEEAVGECNRIVGFSGVPGKNRIRQSTLIDWVDRSEIETGSQSSIALVFGPEDTGLRAEHLNFCSELVAIPTAPENPSLNLSHAVSLVLYELFKQKNSEETRPHTVNDEPLAKEQDYQRACILLDEIAYRTGFYHKGTSASIPMIMHRTLRSTAFTQRQMAIVLGLLNRTTKTLSGEYPSESFPPEEINVLPATLGKSRLPRGEKPQRQKSPQKVE